MRISTQKLNAVDQMLETGFIDEISALYARGDLTPNMPSIRSVGYRQAWAYIENEINYADMRETAIVATRQLCKRQFTWLRRWKEAVWVQEPFQAYEQLMRWADLNDV